MSPEEAAARIIKKLAISSPPVDVQEICRRMGISLLLYGGAKIGKLLGVTSRINTGSGFVTVISVNSRLAPGRMRFTIAHELGHCVLRHEGTLDARIPGGIKYSRLDERHADRFAAELLMPDDILAAEWCWHEPDFLARRYGVSLEAMSIRLEKYVRVL
ncbi:MAG: ImmA/IrrE family metallo-endopeptidase [Synergistaceae bacterium]|nr:ImmA/IrrE family metallo-endopeptidase [Synergistaceae bacterium]